MNFQNPLTNASLSTMWAINKYPDLNDFFLSSRTLGFSKVELNHQVDSKMLSSAHLDQYQFSSIHEPCPADISTKELVKRDWIISSQVEENRKQGVESIKKSIQLAHELTAPVVVIHCGNVSTEMGLENELRVLFHKHCNQSDDALSIKNQMIQSRKDLAGPRLQAVKKSLTELLEFANRYNIKLGLENRYHFMDIPSPDELGELLDLAEPEQLGFIYDSGHAQALDRLGFYRHEDWLKHYSTRMFGCHLHDVLGVTDHYAPGLGELDFKSIAGYLPKNSFRTLEVLSGNTDEQVSDGVRYLVDRGCINYL